MSITLRSFPGRPQAGPRWLVAGDDKAQSSSSARHSRGSVCGATLAPSGKTAIPPQEYPRIITGADAGERGGWPELVAMSRGRGPFND